MRKGPPTEAEAHMFTQTGISDVCFSVVIFMWWWGTNRTNMIVT